MKACVLFSGGKDSSLSAILLEEFFDVELVTCTFGLLPIGNTASNIAHALDFPHRCLLLDSEIIENACNMMIRDGFANNAINFIHREALETLALQKKEFDIFLIADGVRRDDRVPHMEKNEIQSFEDRHNVCYVSPLMGFGRKAINEMIRTHLVIEEDESRTLQKCDYEEELKEALVRKIGLKQADQLFPKSHKQSRVTARI